VRSVPEHDRARVFDDSLPHGAVIEFASFTRGDWFFMNARPPGCARRCATIQIVERADGEFVPEVQDIFVTADSAERSADVCGPAFAARDVK
jgi:hypothetical protein